VLILKREERLSVEASLTVATNEVRVGLSIPLESYDGLPISVVRYVERTREPVVLDRAPDDLRFGGDPYIADRRPKSVLCMALTQKARLTGILYLENNAVEEAFWPGRIELLGLLSAQAAIAVENALLYTDLRTTSEELRRVNEALEDAIAARTDELRQANARLQLELVERESAERARAALHADLLRVQKERLAELSTPLIPITDEIMVMPLIGTMDAERAQQVLQTALNGAETRRVGIVIIDITGVRIVDSSVAATLTRTASALRMLGTEVVITGIRWAVAETLVELDLDFTGTVTRGTLQSGIAYARQRTGEASLDRASVRGLSRGG
jgi:anti-anti-sigma regulatory factor